MRVERSRQLKEVDDISYFLCILLKLVVGLELISI